jgi:hypothetical protein
MIRQLAESVMGRIIGVMIHRREKLTTKGRVAQDAFLTTLDGKFLLAEESYPATTKTTRLDRKH